MARYDLAGNPIPDAPGANNGDGYRPPAAPVDLTDAPAPPSPTQYAPMTPGQPIHGQPLDGAAPREPRPNPGVYAGAVPNTPYGYAAAPDYDSPYSGNDSGHNQTVPPEVAALRWNWGAFFLPPMWCASHGIPALGYVYDLIAIFFLLSPFLYGPTYGVLIFFSTAFVMFGIGIYLGARGNEIAWRNRAFDNGIEGFFQVQKGWMISAFAIALPIYTILMGAFGYQVVRASREQQALLERAANAPRYSAPAFSPQQPVGQPAPPPQTIIYSRPSDMYNRENDMRNNGGFQGGMNGRGPIVIIQRPMAPNGASGASPDAPGANPNVPGNAPGPNTQGGAAPNAEQPVSLPAAGQPSPPQNPPAPAEQPPPAQAPPAPEQPVQNAPPPPDSSANPTPGLPPGQ